MEKTGVAMPDCICQCEKIRHGDVEDGREIEVEEVERNAEGAFL